MLIEGGNGIIRIVLIGECTVAEVEADTDKLRSRVNQSRIDGVEVSVKGLKELDTAYFQLILSLRATADELGVSFKALDGSPVLAELVELFGLDAFKVL